MMRHNSMVNFHSIMAAIINRMEPVIKNAPAMIRIICVEDPDLLVSVTFNRIISSLR